MLVFGHPCDQCGYIGIAEPIGGGFVGCPQCFRIEDMDFNEVIDTPDFINKVLGQPIGV